MDHPFISARDISNLLTFTSTDSCWSKITQRVYTACIYAYTYWYVPYTNIHIYIYTVLAQLIKFHKLVERIQLPLSLVLPSVLAHTIFFYLSYILLLWALSNTATSMDHITPQNLLFIHMYIYIFYIPLLLKIL